MSQISTFSFFSYSGLSKRFWGMSQMQLVHSKLKNVKGLKFYKMLGSGKEFSVLPDFGTYALLMVWSTPNAAKEFFAHHRAYQDFEKHTLAIATYYLKATKVHGLWDNQQPFELNGKMTEGKKIAVLTRASIRPNLAFRFWREVPAVNDAIIGAEGLIFSKGVGEWPLFYQATLSIWENKKAMVNFAYHNPKHVAVIQKTKALDWYSEEMFAEFELVDQV